MQFVYGCKLTRPIYYDSPLNICWHHLVYIRNDCYIAITYCFLWICLRTSSYYWLFGAPPLILLGWLSVLLPLVWREHGGITFHVSLWSWMSRFSRCVAMSTQTRQLHKYSNYCSPYILNIQSIPQNLDYKLFNPPYRKDSIDHFGGGITTRNDIYGPSSGETY